MHFDTTHERGLWYERTAVWRHMLRPRGSILAPRGSSRSTTSAAGVGSGASASRATSTGLCGQWCQIALITISASGEVYPARCGHARCL